MTGTTKITYVTAFLDLNRHEWDIWERRGYTSYLTAFKYYIPLFKQEQEQYELFVYIDRKFYQDLLTLCENIRNIYLIPITENFLFENSLLWRRLDREKEIMNSQEYKSLISHRLDYPENTIPKYNMINHAKIDLIAYTMQLTDSPILGWVDFGYLKNPDIVPNNLLDHTRVDKDRVLFSLVNRIKPVYANIIETLVNAPEIVEGGFFFGYRPALIKYQKLYHSTHSKFHSMNIVDDDQHVILHSYFTDPSLFNLCYQGKWLESMRCFQKPVRISSNDTFFVVHLAGGLGNQLFQIAHGYALARRYGGTVLVYSNDKHDYRQGNPPSKYRYNIFNKIPFITQVDLNKLVTKEGSYTVRETSFNHQDHTVEIETQLHRGIHVFELKGFFQSAMYFDQYKQEIINLFLPPVISTSVYKQNECLMCVRRGDYLLYPEHNPCDKLYFDQAVSIIQSEYGVNTVYVTSDDMDWCKSVFINTDQITYIFSDKQDLEQLYMNSLFKNYIISNSTFHWWSSYMSVYSSTPIVIAPSHWHGGPNSKHSDCSSIYRPDMRIVWRRQDID